MGAYKLEIGGPPKCQNCQRPAKFIVYNTLNQEVGRYCAKHADVRVRELNDPRVLAVQTGSPRP